MLLTIQHDGEVFSPPVEEGVQIEWERTGSPGKLTFTTVTPSSGSLKFTEGDPVCFYYDDEPIFMGYVFTKKHDRENRISVTCYDQLRYLKNKYSYIFENMTATQIIKSICEDLNLYTNDLTSTDYVISAIAEENKSAFDIVLTVLEDTLLNTGNMFVLYDDFGKVRIQNVTDMITDTLICNESAENFDFSSSIDDETYNQVILYYKQNDQITQMYTATSPTTVKQWGTLRYFESTDNPTSGQNKANSLLKLYNRKTRTLKVTGAFGDISVRGGTLIPVMLDLDENLVKNYMLVEKVTHEFNKDYHTMDLTLEGAWDDKEYEIQSKTVGELIVESESTGGGYYGGSTGGTTTNKDTTDTYKKTCVTIHSNGESLFKVTGSYWENEKTVRLNYVGKYITFHSHLERVFSITIEPNSASSTIEGVTISNSRMRISDKTDKKVTLIYVPSDRPGVKQTDPNVNIIVTCGLGVSRPIYGGGGNNYNINQ